MENKEVKEAEMELAKEIEGTEEKVETGKITQKQANKEIEKEVKEEIRKIKEDKSSKSGEDASKKPLGVLDKESHQIKDKAVKKLAEDIKNSKTLLIVGIGGLPSRQFQSIKKTIREHVNIIFAKKNILIRAIEEVKKDSILSLKEHIKENCAFATSDLDGFELAAILLKNKNPIFAKAGQTAPEDISVEKGPTSLVPGPAISEFGALGVQVAVEDGKIAIKKSKVVLNKGQEIRENVASLLQKLEIKPFKIGIQPLIIYNVENGKIYTNIEIDSEKTKEELAKSAGKALGFAQKIAYICKETIVYLLARANSHAKALEKLQSKKETKPEEEKEEKAESESEEKKEETNKEDVKENKEENKNE